MPGSSYASRALSVHTWRERILSAWRRCRLRCHLRRLTDHSLNVHGRRPCKRGAESCRASRTSDCDSALTSLHHVRFCQKILHDDAATYVHSVLAAASLARGCMADVQQQLAAPGSLLPGLGGIMTEGRGAGEQRHGMLEHGRRRNDVQTP